jgi:hypothetical protein
VDPLFAKKERLNTPGDIARRKRVNKKKLDKQKLRTMANMKKTERDDLLHFAANATTYHQLDATTVIKSSTGVRSRRKAVSAETAVLRDDVQLANVGGVPFYNGLLTENIETKKRELIHKYHRKHAGEAEVRNNALLAQQKLAILRGEKSDGQKEKEAAERNRKFIRWKLDCIPGVLEQAKDQQANMKLAPISPAQAIVIPEN